MPSLDIRRGGNRVVRVIIESGQFDILEKIGTDQFIYYVFQIFD
jgi:hypothetical protein